MLIPPSISFHHCGSTKWCKISLCRSLWWSFQDHLSFQQDSASELDGGMVVRIHAMLTGHKAWRCSNHHQPSSDRWLYKPGEWDFYPKSERSPKIIGLFWLVTGWWCQPTPLKNDGVKVSWDDYSTIPNMIGKIKAMFQTTNQSLVMSLMSVKSFADEKWCPPDFSQPNQNPGLTWKQSWSLS